METQLIDRFEKLEKSQREALDKMILDFSKQDLIDDTKGTLDNIHQLYDQEVNLLKSYTKNISTDAEYEKWSEVYVELLNMFKEYANLKYKMDRKIHELISMK